MTEGPDSITLVMQHDKWHQGSHHWQVLLCVSISGFKGTWQETQMVKQKVLHVPGELKTCVITEDIPGLMHVHLTSQQCTTHKLDPRLKQHMLL